MRDSERQTASSSSMTTTSGSSFRMIQTVETDAHRGPNGPPGENRDAPGGIPHRGECRVVRLGYRAREHQSPAVWGGRIVARAEMPHRHLDGVPVYRTHGDVDRTLGMI